MIWIDVQRGIDLSRRFLIFMLVEEHKREYPVSKGLIWIERDGPSRDVQRQLAMRSTGSNQLTQPIQWVQAR